MLFFSIKLIQVDVSISTLYTSLYLGLSRYEHAYTKLSDIDIGPQFLYQCIPKKKKSDNHVITRKQLKTALSAVLPIFWFTAVCKSCVSPFSIRERCSSSDR